MKKLITNCALLALFILLLSSTSDTGGSFDARLNTHKQDCKLAIKPARYEGSRITYYSGSKETQKKTVEAFLLLDTEYKFAFSGKECSGKVSARIYDNTDEKKRTLLKEIKAIQGKNVVISSNDLTKVYNKKYPQGERLKIIYIEYRIEPSSEKNEAIVMVVGYND